jgi:hypothetical protein
MAEALQAADPPQFFVMLLRYFIEGEEYRAFALTVSATATPNLVQTQTGFACDAYFPPDLLSPGTLRGKQQEGEVVKVRLTAQLEDILQIANIGGAG